MLTDIYDNSTTALTLITAIGIIWAAGKGFMAIVRGLKQIYRKSNQKNWLFQRIRASIYALIFMVLIIASLILMVFGNNIMNFTMKYIPQLTNVVIVFRGILTVNIFCFQVYLYQEEEKSSIKRFPELSSLLWAGIYSQLCILFMLAIPPIFHTCTEALLLLS